MDALKCDRCGNYFDCNQLRLRGGKCNGESFGHISVRGEHNHYCNYDLCDDCVADFFQWVNDPGKLMGGDAGGQENFETVQSTAERADTERQGHRQAV